MIRKSERLPGQIIRPRHVNMEFLGGRDWKLHQDPNEPVRFVTAVGNRILTPPDNYIFDGASIPRLCWRLIGPPTGYGEGADYMLPAALHDIAYERGKWDDGSPMTRQQADAILWEACMDMNVDEWRADAMYKAVHIFGGFKFCGHRHWGEPMKSDYTVEGGKS